MGFLCCFLLIVSLLERLLYYRTESVKVDLDNPYNNGFVSVYPLIGIPASNDVEQHQGFAISLPLDKRHFLRDNTLNVNARLYSKNIVKISGVPMADYGMLYHGADAIKTLQQSGVWSEFDFLIDGCKQQLHEPSHFHIQKDS